MKRARDLLLEILRDEGVTHIFGNPGSRASQTPLARRLPRISSPLGSLRRQGDGNHGAFPGF